MVCWYDEMWNKSRFFSPLKTIWAYDDLSGNKKFIYVKYLLRMELQIVM